MIVEQIYTGCLAEAAYYIESDGEAVIIDPLRDTKPYLDRLQASGAKLKYIFETHFHADFVSGHLDLAKKTGATIVYGPNAQAGYEIYRAEDGERLKVGKVTFVVLHTPGHTMESTTFKLCDEDGRDHAIFTGDTLFLGDVGRPDLAIRQGEISKEDLAGHLYDSLRNKILPLADDVIVYPGHGAGSACGKHLSSETWGLLGEEKKSNYALRSDMTKAEFIAEVTQGLMPPPQYFGKNALLNKQGASGFDQVLKSGTIALSYDDFVQVVEHQGALILDTRSVDEFASGHIPQSIFIGLDNSFAPWVGALITDIKQPIVLIASAGREAEAVTRLARVGYDHTLGYLKGGIQGWKEKGGELASIDRLEVKELSSKLGAGISGEILDVRKPAEFLSQHVKNATNFPLDYINTKMNRLDRTTKYYLYCRSGYRSMVAASILKARGFHHLVDVKNGWEELVKSDIPLTTYVCPTELTDAVVDAAIEAVV